MGVLVGLLVGWMVLPSTPRSVMLSQAHPRGEVRYEMLSGGECYAPRWARARGEMLAGSHQWCVDAGQSLVVGWLPGYRSVGGFVRGAGCEKVIGGEVVIVVAWVVKQ